MMSESLIIPDEADEGTALLESSADEIVPRRQSCNCCSCMYVSSGVWATLRLLIVQALERVAFYVIIPTITEYVAHFLDLSSSSPWSILILVNVVVGVMYTLSPIYGWLSDAKLGHFFVLVCCFIMYLVGATLIFASAYIQDGSAPQMKIGEGLYYAGLLVIALFAVPGIRATLTPFLLEQLTGDADQRNRYLKAFVSWSYFATNVGGACAMAFGGYLQSLQPPGLTAEFSGFVWKYLLGVCALGVAVIILIFWKNQYKHYHPRAISRPSMLVVCHAAWCRKPERQHFDKDLLRQHQQEASTEAESEERQRDEHVRRLAELVPLMSTMIVYFTIYSQSVSTFTEQGHHLDFDSLREAPIPPWDLPLIFDPLAVIITVPLMQYILKPLYERITGKIIYILPCIRWGMVLAAFACVSASLVDSVRMHCCDFTRICTKMNKFNVCECFSEMSVGWQVPQYVLMGVSEVLAVVGFMEFVLSRSPREFRCTTFGFLQMIKGIGRYVGALILFILRKIDSSWYYPAKTVESKLEIVNCSLQDERLSAVYNYFVVLCFIMIFNTVFYMIVEAKYRKYTRYAPLQRRYSNVRCRMPVTSSA